MTTAAPPTDAKSAVDDAVNQPAEPSTASPSQGAVTPPPAEPNRETRRAEAKAAKKEATSTKKKVATFEDLRAKKRRRSSVEINLYDEDGEPETLSITIQAISSVEYDKMIAECPPTAVQRARNDVYNMDEFAPQLISACSINPKMTFEQVKELYESDEWSTGEIGNLFWACSNLCTAGMNIPFTVAG